MRIVMREVDGKMDGVIDTEAEQGALMYVSPQIPLPGLIKACYRRGIGIETLVITEIDRETDIGTMMAIVRAVGKNLETDGDLGIEMP